MSSKAVNVPTDNKVKEKDINAKLQLYGIYSAFAKGKAPSNKQIDVALNTALGWGPMQTPPTKLSQDGQKLVTDLRAAIEKAKILLLTKNEGNLIQDFIWQTQGIGAGDAKTPGAPIDKETAQQHGQQAVEGLRTLGQLIITNGQFRKLLSDSVTLFRDIAGDAAQNAASAINPDEERLAQIDKPAEDNTWHEAPDLSKDNIRNQIKSNVPVGKQDAKEHAKEVAGDATQAAHPSGSRDPADAAERARREQQTGGSTSVDPRQGAQAAAERTKQKTWDQMDENDKQKVREYRQQTKEYFQKKVPKERREQTVYRLKKMIVEIQGHQDYQQAIDTLLRLAEEYTGHTKDVAAQSQGAVKGAHNQDTLNSAEADLRTLLERFANSTSFDDLFDSINQIYRDADRDPELKSFFRGLNRFIRRCLQEQGYVLQDESNEEWNKLYDHGNFLLRDRYRNHTDRIVDEVKFLATQFEEDRQNKEFADAMDKLFKDLGNDSDGKPEFKPHLIKDLTEVIIPGFFENVRYVPIPRIEVSDPQIDAIVENLVLEGDNLAPNMFEFGSDNYWRWGRKGFQSKNKNKVMLAVSGIQMDLRDVAYYVKKKQGFPSITDKGLLDIFLGGTGLSFKVAMETADKKDRSHFFKINTISVDVKNVNIKVKQSNHKLLFSLFKPVLLKVLRPVIQKVVEKQIRDSVQQLDAFLYQVKQEVDRVTEEAKNNPDPENIQNIYQKYFNAFQKQMQKGQQKKEAAKERAKDTNVNVAVTQNDSIFKNISLPGGISTKATEYQELAGKGDRWESPIFSIGSASETKNLPAAQKVTRKPHSATPAVLKDSSERSAAGGPGVGASAGGLNQSTARSAADLPVAQGTPYGSGSGIAGQGRQVGGNAPYQDPSFSTQVDGAFQPTRQI
ncbi:putative bactericidal permeability-increasing protein, alpha/beta domain superfamily [Septoria linicola]|nr:putative bactericidal permeability-increasing protein, alpha/beta domain superfamily [Septoria linicola]